MQESLALPTRPDSLTLHLQLLQLAQVISFLFIQMGCVLGPLPDFILIIPALSLQQIVIPMQVVFSKRKDCCWFKFLYSCIRLSKSSSISDCETSCFNVLSKDLFSFASWYRSIVLSTIALW
jgi:hypothetical protein